MRVVNDADARIVLSESCTDSRISWRGRKPATLTARCLSPLAGNGASAQRLASERPNPMRASVSIMAKYRRGIRKGQARSEFHQSCLWPCILRRAAITSLRALDCLDTVSPEEFHLLSKLRGRRGWANTRVASEQSVQTTPRPVERLITQSLSTQYSARMHAHSQQAGRLPFPSKGNSPNRSSTLR